MVVLSDCVWESESYRISFFFFLIQPHPFSFAFYLAYDLGLTFGTEIILVSSANKAEETAGHYDKNYGRGISLYKHLFPLLSLKVLQYLIDSKGVQRFSIVEYLKRERKSELTLFISFSFAIPLSTEASHFRTSVLFVSSAQNPFPPHICMLQSSFRYLLNVTFSRSEAIPDPSIKNHNLSWLLYYITSYSALFSLTYSFFISTREGICFVHYFS